VQKLLKVHTLDGPVGILDRGPVGILDGPVGILIFFFNMINTVSKKRLAYIPTYSNMSKFFRSHK
jgi:hypothetical protein